MRISDWSSDVCSSDLSFEVSTAPPSENRIFDDEREISTSPSASSTSFLSSATHLRGTMTSGIPAAPCGCGTVTRARRRSEEHTSALQSLMRSSYAVFCLTKKSNLKKDDSTIHD